MPISPTGQPHALEALFYPRAVAVVGASDRAGSVGRSLSENLLAGFKGPIYLVTPSRPEVLGRITYPSLDALPEAVDLTIVCVPRDAVETVLREGISRGNRNYVITAAGFGEVDEAGRLIENRIAALAAEHDLRIVGPNTVGLINRHCELNATFATWSRRSSVPGGLAIMAQSGGFGSMLHDLAVSAGFGIANFVGSGNEVNLSIADYLSFAASDDRVSTVWIYLEQVADGHLMLEQIVKLRGRGVAVVAVVGGRGQSGKRASLSHTGAVAGNALVAAQLLRRAGAIVCDCAEDVLDIGIAQQSKEPLTGRRLAILAHSGGIGVNAADLASEHNLIVPELGDPLRQQLAEILPPFVIANNPVDPTPAITRDVAKLTRLLQTVDDSGEFDALIICGALGDVSLEFARIVAGVLPQIRMPVFVAWSSPSEGIAAIFQSVGVPFFDDVRRLFRTLDRLAPAPGAGDASVTPPGWVDPEDRAELDREITHLLPVPEDVATVWLRDAGLATVPSGVALTASQAAGLAERVGLPCVLKSVSPDVPHRGKVGAISVGVSSIADVDREYNRIRGVVEDLGAACAERILVQALATGSGQVEAFIGIRIDPSFGPVLSVGFGGGLVEMLGDVQATTLPVSYQSAHDLIGATTLLGRVIQPEFQHVLAEMMEKVSVLFVEWHRDHGVVEIDINPVVFEARSSAALALDVLAVRETARVDGNA